MTYFDLLIWWDQHVNHRNRQSSLYTAEVTHSGVLFKDFSNIGKPNLLYFFLLNSGDLLIRECALVRC